MENSNQKQKLLQKEKELQSELHQFIGRSIADEYKIHSISDFEQWLESINPSNKSESISDVKRKIKANIDTIKEIIVNKNISKTQLAIDLNKYDNYIYSFISKANNALNKNKIGSLLTVEKNTSNLIIKINNLYNDIDDSPVKDQKLDDIKLKIKSKKDSITKLLNQNPKIKSSTISKNLKFNSFYISTLFWKIDNHNWPSNKKNIYSLYDKMIKIETEVKNQRLKLNAESESNKNQKSKRIKNLEQKIKTKLENTSKSTEELSKDFGQPKYYIDNIIKKFELPINGSIGNYESKLNNLNNFLEYHNNSKTKPLIKKTTPLDLIKPQILQDSRRKILISIKQPNDDAPKYYAKIQNNLITESYLDLTYTQFRLRSKLFDFDAAEKFYKGFTKENPEIEIYFDIIEASDVKKFV